MGKLPHTFDHLSKDTKAEVLLKDKGYTRTSKTT